MFSVVREMTLPNYRLIAIEAIKFLKEVHRDCEGIEAMQRDRYFWQYVANCWAAGVKYTKLADEIEEYWLYEYQN